MYSENPIQVCSYRKFEGSNKVIVSWKFREPDIETIRFNQTPGHCGPLNTFDILES